MIYDGVELKDYVVTRGFRPLMASPEVSLAEVAGRDRLYVSDVKLNPVEIEAVCAILPDSDGIYTTRKIEEAKRLLAPLLYKKQLRPLVLDDNPELHYMAVLTDVSTGMRKPSGETVKLTFTCEPYAYSDEIEATVSSGVNSIHIGGSMPTRPVFEVRAASSVSSITITNNDSGLFVKVPASYSAGAVLMVDMGARRATINGNDARVDIMSDFFELAPGKNNIKLSSGSGTMRYEEVWL